MVTHKYELQLSDGTRYRIECTSEDIDRLIHLIGEENLTDCEEL